MAAKYGHLIIVLYLTVSGRYVQSEPSCSKYDYEEKLLEKMVRIEFQMEQYKTQMEASLKRLDNVKNDFDKKVIDTEEKIQEMMIDMNNTVITNANTITTLVQNVDDMNAKEADTSSPAMFKAIMLADTSPFVDETLVFKTILYNYNNGYSNNTGVFTVPKDGNYIFGMTLCLTYKQGIVAGFEVDGKKATAHAFYGGPGNECFSVTTTEVLTQGQQVRLKRFYGFGLTTQIRQSDAYRWTMFHGSLIHV
ncbi:hypothetical protein ACF0H5_023901 [Mactra antiquata]